MDVKFTLKMCQEIGWPKFQPFDIDKDSFRWNEKVKLVDLTRFSPERLKKLAAMLEPHRATPGIGPSVGAVVRDIAVWQKVLEGGAKGAPARHAKQAVPLMREFLRTVPGHRIYERDNGRLLAYYVNKVEATQHRGDKTTYWTMDIEVVHREFGKMHSRDLMYYTSDVNKLTPSMILLRKGFYAETPELREEYLKDYSWFDAIAEKVGKQMEATGHGDTSLDGNVNDEEETGRYSWSRYSNGVIRLDKGGEPARVVIDVYSEKDDSDGRDVALDRTFWLAAENVITQSKTTGRDPDLEEEDLDDLMELANEENNGQKPEEEVIEVPVHPVVAIFDLKRHLRMRVHATQLVEHVYDKGIGARLVLPKDSRSLVDMLVAHTGGFNDVIRGKGGGAVILCAGPPGVGKTLTAEVYSEAEERALYSVQCSQLGTDPKTLEKALIKVFARANRWNAILLLDEADVYVMARGRDLQQNAIVGVFLRVLEYYSGVLFLTTNRSDSVDDAIASRCIARIDYRNPKPNDLKRIWSVLAKVAEVPLEEVTIDKLVKEHPNLSGRDVKNLLKLSKLVAATRKCAVTPDVVRFVKRFKPTLGANEEHGEAAPIRAGDAAMGEWYYMPDDQAMLYAANVTADGTAVIFADDSSDTTRTVKVDDTVVPAKEE